MSIKNESPALFMYFSTGNRIQGHKIVYNVLSFSGFFVVQNNKAREREREKGGGELMESAFGYQLYER